MNAETRQMTECDKVAEYAEDINTIKDFLEWLNKERGVILCERTDWELGDLYQPLGETMESYIWQYLGINPVALERERREYLQGIRENTETFGLRTLVTRGVGG